MREKLKHIVTRSVNMYEETFPGIYITKFVLRNIDTHVDGSNHMRWEFYSSDGGVRVEDFTVTEEELNDYGNTWDWANCYSSGLLKLVDCWKRWQREHKIRSKNS